MIVLPFNPDHLEQLRLQPAQAHFYAHFRPEYGAALAKGGEAFTGMAGEQIVGCAGMVRQWENRGIVWALLSADAGQHFMAIHRAVCAWLVRCDLARIEATVDCDFTSGHRWMRMLGFVCEAPVMRAYTPDGRDCALYARVRGH